MTDEELLIRANEARILLENSLLVEALAHYEQEITERWKTSPLRDVDGREKLRLMLEAHNNFKAYLHNTLESGKLAKVSPGSTSWVASIIGRN